MGKATLHTAMIFNIWRRCRKASRAQSAIARSSGGFSMFGHMRRRNAARDWEEMLTRLVRNAGAPPCHIRNGAIRINQPISAQSRHNARRLFIGPPTLFNFATAIVNSEPRRLGLSEGNRNVTISVRWFVCHGLCGLGPFSLEFGLAIAQFHGHMCCWVGPAATNVRGTLNPRGGGKLSTVLFPGRNLEMRLGFRTPRASFNLIGHWFL